MMKTLFVADNNELDLRILRFMLIKNPVFKHELYFKDAQSLIDYVQCNLDDAVNLPDAIFLEINMPQKNAWRILAFLDIMYDRLVKPVAVYIISTSVSASEIQRALQYRFVKEFIPKPIYLNKIMAIGKEDNIYSS